jgi:hypothetical protein
MSLDFKQILGDGILGKLDEHGLTQGVLDALSSKKLIEDTGEKDPTKWVPYGKFSEKLEEIKALKAQIEQRDKDMTGLQEKVKAGENVTQTLEEIKQSREKEKGDYEKNIKQIKIRSAAEFALLSAAPAKPGYVHLLLPEVMKHADKFVEIEEGKFSGLDDVVKRLKEHDDYKGLFNAYTPSGKPPGEANGGDMLYNGKKASELGLTEKVMLKKDKPELFEKMFS